MSSRMTFAEYRAIDAVNWSTLSAMKDSPAHYLAAVENGRKDTAALQTGRLLDCLIFTPDEFAARFVISPYDDFRSKDAKAWRDEQTAEIVKADALTEARALADAVRRHPVARRYMDLGKFQVPLLWTDPETRLRCKGLADLIGPSFLVDGKSAQTIDKRRYASKAGGYLYHCQLAHYRAGMRIALNVDPGFIGHIAYEKGAPYDVAVFEFAPAVIDSGEVIVRELLNRVAECRASGKWPGRYPDVEMITNDDMPRWLDDEADESAEDLGITPAS